MPHVGGPVYRQANKGEKLMWDGLWRDYIENWDRVFYEVIHAGRCR